MPKEAKEPILSGENARISKDLQWEAREGRGRKAEDFKRNEWPKNSFFTASFDLWKKVKITGVMRGVSNTAVSDESSLYGCGEVGKAWGVR